MSDVGAARGGVIAYAPGSIGNIGPGLDVLGCALTGVGDEVHAWWSDEHRGVTVVETGHPDITADPARNACALAARAVLDQASETPRGIALAVTKGLPLAGGQGGSGASAVAAAVAVNQLIVAAGGTALDTNGLLAASLVAESVVAGRHLDNLAPSLMGGVVCVRSVDPPDVHHVPVHTAPWFALALPDIRLRTADARAALPAMVSRA
jgi:homoserine kinase